MSLLGDDEEGTSGVSADDNEAVCPMTLLAVSEWSEVLVPELRARGAAFSSVDWPVFFNNIPAINLPLYTGSADMTGRMELILDAAVLFCDEIGAAIEEHIDGFEFVLTANVEALFLARRVPGYDQYRVSMVLLEHMNRLVDAPRLLVYERARHTGLLTVVHSDTNTGRALLKLTPSMLFVQLLTRHIFDAREPLAPHSEPRLYANYEALSAIGARHSEPLARFFAFYLIGPRRLALLSDLARSTVHVFEKQLDDPDIRLQQLAPKLAASAPTSFDAGDIYALMSALYLALSFATAAADKDSEEEDVVVVNAKRRRKDTLAVVDQAIERYRNARRPLAPLETPPSQLPRGDLIEL